MQLPPFHVHPDVVIILGTIWAVYILAWTDRSASRDDPDKRRRIAFFTAGMVVLGIGATWPIHDIAEQYLYSFHMVQHMLFQLVAAPMLLAGIPAWMWRGLLRPWAMSIWRRITRPLPALLIFNGILLLSHWPSVVDLTLQHHVIHFLAHFVMVISAIVMWWPVLSPLPEAPAIAPPMQMLYLFLQSLAPTIPASFLTFGDHPLYKIYETFPRLWGISTVSDQRTSGLIMKLVGGFILWGFITIIFFRWYYAEQRDEGWEPLRVPEARAAKP